MESNYNNRDFEEFVKQNADQYRMFPSERVWKGINNVLHKRRRWYGIGLALLLLTSGTVTWVMLNPAPDPDQQLVPGTQAITANSQPASTDKTPPGAIITVASVPKATTPKQSIATLPGLTPQEREIVFPFENSAVNNLIAKAEHATLEMTVPGPQTIHTIALRVKEEKIAVRVAAATSSSTISNKPFTNILDNNSDIAQSSTKNFEMPLLLKTPELYPMSIESVVNSYQPLFRKKLDLQLYFTPTVSYRKLRENKSYMRSTALAGSPSNLAALADVNSVVTHKPDMGLELGASVGYQVTPVMKFKGGVQFNMSRYDIKAFTANGEVATLALSSGTDVVNVSTNLRNKGGYQTNWLQNLYFSVSAPVGVEMKLGDNGHTSLNIGGTLQPTYIISDRAYLLSTDYKNYVEVPWLIRRWNITTSMEAFVAYETGKLKWQVGPQVRYQLLSSFQEKYPVRENLFDFGLKVGIMLNR